ncbi:MAG: carbohydrate ABC transporter permease [Candidatus Limiplasma sp.]|nr:carbohydrate ABC transporter permease [Candidatus Limiplasma sp.]
MMHIAAISQPGKRRIAKSVATVLFALIACTMVLPFVWMVSTSLKDSKDVFNYPVEWIPKTFNFSHYQRIWTGEDPLSLYYVNSIITTFIPIFFGVLTCSLAAYGFTKLEFKGRDALFFCYVALMMIPPQILFIPKFLMFKEVGIYNTHLSLILPHCFSIFGVFLMRQNFLSIPIELNEAAIVDGANHLQIWWRIVMPQAKPIIASFCILAFTWYWNDFENPMIFISRQELYTIPLALNKFVLEDGVDYPGMMAVAASGILPIILVFLFAQKYIIESVASSGVKG